MAFVPSIGRVIDPNSEDAIPKKTFGTGRKPKYNIKEMRPGDTCAFPNEDQKLIRTTVSNVKWTWPQRRFETWRVEDELFVKRLDDLSLEEYQAQKAETDAKKAQANALRQRLVERGSS
jgi:hypothetical protein